MNKLPRLKTESKRINVSKHGSTQVIGDMIVGSLPNGEVGIMLYKSDDQMLETLVKKRRPLMTRRQAKNIAKQYADFVTEKRANLEGSN